MYSHDIHYEKGITLHITYEETSEFLNGVSQIYFLRCDCKIIKFKEKDI